MLEEKHSVLCFRFLCSALPIQMNLDLGLDLGHRQFSSRQPQGLRIALSWITHRPPTPSPIQFPINHPSPGKSSQFRFTALHCPCCYLFFKFSFLHLASKSLRYGHLSVNLPPNRLESLSQSADQVQFLKHKSARPLSTAHLQAKSPKIKELP